MKGLDKDIDFTSRVISELGSLLKDAQVQALVSEQSINLARDAVAECDAVFRAMEDVISNIRKNGMGKWKFYFRESKIEFLRSNLDRMKGNLQLLMQVIIHATQLSSERPDETTMAAHRMNIRKLMIEKEVYTQKYLEEKRKYDDLLAQVNSTSTLGSISAALAEDLETGPSSVHANIPNDNSKIGRSDGNSRNLGNTVASKETVPKIGGLDGQSGPQHPNTLRSLTSDVFPGMATTRGFNPSSGSSSGRESHEQQDIIMISPVSTSDACQQRRRPRGGQHLPTESETIQGAVKCDKAAKFGRRMAKGAGYAAVGTVAVIFFPITIVYLVFLRKRRAQTKETELPTLHPDNGPSNPAAIYDHYHSADIPAELPAVHELSGFHPELDLISTLTYYNPNRVHANLPATASWPREGSKRAITQASTTTPRPQPIKKMTGM
ncbi:MAG: hypothetical protein M1839_004888 [Geoglossum umbratile]|nr:MAG: hypothetical protein M1839_004888 [Geoglossum umbratile]